MPIHQGKTACGHSVQRTEGEWSTDRVHGHRPRRKLKTRKSTSGEVAIFGSLAIKTCSVNHASNIQRNNKLTIGELLPLFFKKMVISVNFNNAKITICIS